MEKFVVLVVLVALFALVYGALGSPLSGEEDGEIWTLENWQGYPPERGLSIRLADFIKRSKAQQFHGLMGRSSETSQPVRLGKKSKQSSGNKGGEMFVGLMGRRSSDRDSEEEWKPEYY